MPLEIGTSDGFRFPGEFTGQYGVYEQVHTINKHIPTQNTLNKEHRLFASKEYFAQEQEKGIQAMKKAFREKHGIPHDGTVVFFAPGNDFEEAEFSLEPVRLGIKEFILKYSSPTSLSARAPPASQFCTVISVHKGSHAEQLIRNHIEERDWQGRVILVDEQDDMEFALCGSDFGFIYDGQMVSRAAAAHLPTGILIKMRQHHQWYHDLFNRWQNDMVITADNNIYKEIIGGELWKGKICDTLAEWYLRPDQRYDLVKKWEYFLKDAMSYEEIDRSVVKS